jgi:hypothetical protein
MAIYLAIHVASEADPEVVAKSRQFADTRPINTTNPNPEGVK